MNKFEELHGSQTQTIAALEAENAKLREFVSKFSDNFSDCDYCNGKGVFSDDMIDSLDALVHTQLAMASHRTNEIVRLLTLFSVFFLPLTFIVGIYGMNFDNMPELRSKNGYFIVLGIMFLLVLGMIYYFKRRRWF